MKRRSFMLVQASGGAVIALPGCDTLAASATAPWADSGPSETAPRLRALAWALWAPNPHNLQSWVADIREPGLIHLSVDLQRLQPATDPHHRQVLIGCGAFLELLCLAAAQHGQRAQVMLLPEGDYAAGGVDGRRFATVRLTADATVQGDPLFAAVPRRRTNRAPYDDQVPRAQALALLAAAAQRPGITLHSSTNAVQVRRLSELAIAGHRVEFQSEATEAESTDPVRVGTAAAAALASSVSATSHTHAWAWLSSADNSRRTQIEAGRAYLRVDLTAAQQGLAIHPNSQVLQEFEAMSALYRQFHAEVGVAQPARVQMFVRLGYAPRPEPAPRRPLGRLVRA